MATYIGDKGLYVPLFVKGLGLYFPYLKLSTFERKDLFSSLALDSRITDSVDGALKSYLNHFTLLRHFYVI